MILVSLKSKKLAEQVCALVSKSGLQIKEVDPFGTEVLSALYERSYAAIIVDVNIPSIPAAAQKDILTNIAAKVPVILVDDKSTPGITSDRYGYSSAITVVDSKNNQEIVSTIDTIVLGTDDLRNRISTIPVYNSLIAINMIKKYGGLGILTIDASSFVKISTNYGSAVYQQMQEILEDILFKLWGTEGSFRKNDVIVRRVSSQNEYLVFLDRSRATGALPYPGALEKIADRISIRLHNALWDELFAPFDKKRAPSCVDNIPLIGVGFFGVLNNPCMNTAEILSQGLDASKQMAMSQQKRGKERQRELMHSLIQSDELLTPNYQAVFRLQEISKEDMDEVKSENSIAPIASTIFGFESLIRVNQDEVTKQNVCATGVDSKYLRPDVMFSLAKNTKVALELDQACMKHAAKYAQGLPGCLMINILPRNLYHIDKLKEQFKNLDSVVFEVSESEAINNFDLMLKAKESLKKSNMGIAADDFGKGYSSIERVIKIRPNVIKFDRSMITDIHKDPIKKVYVKGLVEAAEILEAEVLVEGVEIWEEAAVLKEMGVSLVQGFLFHRPQPVGIIKKQLEEAKDKEKSKTNLNAAS